MLQPNGLYWLGLGSGGCALLAALILSRRLKKPLSGSSGLFRAKSMLRKGALSLFKWQALLLFALLALGFADLMVLSSFGYLPNPYLPAAFLTGALCAFLPQLLDLRFAPQWLARIVAAAAASPRRSMALLLTSGRIRAFASLGLTVTEVSGWFCFLTLREGLDPGMLTETLLTFGLGGGAVALFARHLGFFSAAGILGSIPLEEGDKTIPPEDQRNPAAAVYAMSSFLHDPAAGTAAAWRCLLVASFILGLLSYGPEDLGIQAMLFPLLVASAGVLATLISALRGLPEEKPLDRTLSRRLWANLWLTLLLTGAAAMPFAFLMFGTLRPCLPLALGLLCAPAVAWSTRLSAMAPPPEDMSSDGKVPVRAWLTIALYGALPLVLLLGALLGAFWLHGGRDSPIMGLYGVTLAGVGLLAPMGDLLTLSSCGGLAQGVISLTWMSGDMAEPDWAPGLALLGQRFSTAGRGYSLALTLTSSLLLLLAWMGSRAMVPTLSLVLAVGILLGLLLVCTVAALLLLGCKKTVVSLRGETQRQFKEIKGLRSGKEAPHTLSCVDLTNGRSLFWILAGVLLTLVFPALAAALGTAGALGFAIGAVTLSLLSGFFLITAGDHWTGTPLADAVLPLRWAVGPVVGELALLAMTALAVLM